MTSRKAGIWILCIHLFLFVLCSVLPAQEFRAFWVDAFNPGFKTPEQITQLVSNLRMANCNAMIVEVRKRGDAYYNSRFEPKASDIASDFDPLQDLVNKAHDTNAGPRLEVHAWIVSYPVWSNKSNAPVQPDHPYNLHPDWLMRDTGQNTWATSFYVQDPGHPEVQRHLFNVAMDIVSRYDVDGINFDYIRYPGTSWGYNPQAVARFNARYGRSGQPSPLDPTWLQWRRDQVTALVRKVYLSTMAIKPQVKISADTITWAPGITSDLSWTNSARAYNEVLQDWRSWMQEGILDINMPMAYFRQESQYALDYLRWNDFAKDRRYNRHVVIGPGLYLNSISNAIYMMRLTREPSTLSNRSDGVTGYSYATPASNSIANLQSVFLNALTQPSAYDSTATPLFAVPATMPSMPWKTAPTTGHLIGYLKTSDTGLDCDGAIVQLEGPLSRTLQSDVTGFFGTADLPPGSYMITVTMPSYVSQSNRVQISMGTVSRLDVVLERKVVLFDELRVVAGSRNALIEWRTPWPASAHVELTTSNWTQVISAPLPQDSLATSHSIVLGNLAPGTSYQVVAIYRQGTNVYRSTNIFFVTAGDIVIDNAQAILGGTWSIASSSSDKYLADYRFTISVSGEPTRTATFAPRITTPGFYDVYEWHPQGINRSAKAPFTIFYDGGFLTTNINQQTGGGRWQLLAEKLPFAAGMDGYVQLANNSSETGLVVVADAVKFVYSLGQEPPAMNTAPHWWMRHYFGSNTNTLADADGDGYPNWMEFLLGTCPTSAVSRLSLGLDNTTTLQLTFMPYLSGRAYEVQYATQLMQNAIWQSWTNLTLYGTNEMGIYQIPSNNMKSLFFRLKAGWPAE